MNFPDVLLVAGEYQVQRAAAVRPGQRVRRRRRRGRQRATGFAVGDRVTGAGMFGAFAERVAVDPAGLAPHSRRRRLPHRGGVRCRAPHGVPHAALDGARSRPATSSSCSAPAAVSGWRPSNRASRWVPRSPRSRHRPRSWRWQRVTAPTHLDQSPRTGDLRDARCATPFPTVPTSSSIRSAANWPNPHCVAAPRRPVRHRRLRVGRHPPHPAEPGAGQGRSRARLPVPGRAARRIRTQRGRVARPARRPAGCHLTSARCTHWPKRRGRCATSPTAVRSARC